MRRGALFGAAAAYAGVVNEGRQRRFRANRAATGPSPARAIPRSATDEIVKIAVGLNVDAGEIVSGLPLSDAMGAKVLTATIMMFVLEKVGWLDGPGGSSGVGPGQDDCPLAPRNPQAVRRWVCALRLVRSSRSLRRRAHPASDRKSGARGAVWAAARCTRQQARPAQRDLI